MRQKSSPLRRYRRGKKSTLALQLGLSPVTLRAYENGTRLIPAERVLAIERATGGKVTRYELRPDIFGPAPGVDPPVLAEQE